MPTHLTLKWGCTVGFRNEGQTHLTLKWGCTGGSPGTHLTLKWGLFFRMEVGDVLRVMRRTELWQGV
jgi:hypothetical protein